MNAFNTPPPPTWSDGFVVGYGEHRLSICFVAGMPVMSDREEAEPSVYHSPVIMSHTTARHLSEAITSALKATGETAEESP